MEFADFNKELDELLPRAYELGNTQGLSPKQEQELKEMHSRIGQLVILQRFDDLVLAPAINGQLSIDNM